MSAAAPSADVAAQGAGDAAPLQWIYVTYIYCVGCLVCAVFAVFDYVFEVEHVKGFWMIFSLFPFCLVYSIYRHRIQAREQRESKPKAD